MTNEREPLSTRCVGTEECPKCGSLDNVKVYDDGHKKCFSGGCSYWVKPERAPGEEAWREEGEERMRTTPSAPDGTSPSSSPLLEPTLPDAWDRLKRRHLESRTLRAFGYFKARVHGQGGLADVGVAPFYDQQGRLVIQKLRYPGKQFAQRKAPDAPPIDQCKLFGQHVYGERFKKCVVTTGELDAMSVAQANDLQYLACLSVNGGDDSAVKCFKANWRYLDTFEEIILWFDDDESGNRVAEQCAQLFAVGKVKIVKMAGIKDASQALQEGRSNKELVDAIRAANTWRPRGIINAADCLPDVLDASVAARGYDWPFKSLNENTTGVIPGGVTYIVAGTGVGKTTALYEVEYSLWKQGATLGIMGFEDMRRDIQLGLLGVHLSKRLGIEPVPAETLRQAHGEVFGSRRVHLFDPETAEWSMKAIFDYARYMVRALGCNVIVVDPLSFIAAGLGASDDERRALDAASRDFSALAKEMGCHFLIAHHLKRIEGKGHENGGEISLAHLRGSGGIANFATLVFGFERDQQDVGEEDEGALTGLRILKNRKVGKTGLVGHLQYNTMTGRLQDAPASVLPNRANSSVKAAAKSREEQDYG